MFDRFLDVLNFFYLKIEIAMIVEFPLLAKCMITAILLKSKIFEWMNSKYQQAFHWGTFAAVDFYGHYLN